ncbi:MAG: putative DeoR family transcriptional regulator, stage sporulation protein [Thermosediminibacterales bacterium]|nr:putative DeoR family transcriptional regulator, stage sporulation protein [Thermosediminibacterales bacterium]
MKDYMRVRVLEIAKYVIDTKATVRKAAKVFGVSKSTVHKDMTERLPKINPEIAKKVKEVLAFNKAERHIRGGKATKRKYQNLT